MNEKNIFLFVFHHNHHHDEKVAFVRHRDLHILTVGSYTYTTDQRFIATHHKKTDEWTLQIKWTQKRDAGVILQDFFFILNMRRTNPL